MVWLTSIVLGMASAAMAFPQVARFPMNNGTTTSQSLTSSDTSTFTSASSTSLTASTDTPTSTSPTSSTTSTSSGGVIIPPTTNGPTTTTSDIVTSTLTLPPTAFSTEKATNTQWSSNTWVTTSKDGHQTIVPVIVGCPGCGPIPGGIVIWGFPPVPGTVFSFPGFPGLPPFHLPCIKVFGISAGDCPSNPVDDTGTDNDPDKTTKTKDPKTSTESKQTTSSTTSSTSSCTTHTATDCTVACVTGATSSCSTVCKTVTACSATGSTTTTSSGSVCTKDPGNAEAGQVQEWSYDGFQAFTVPNPWGKLTSMTSHTVSTTSSSSSVRSATSTHSTPKSTSESSSSSKSDQSSSTKSSSSTTTTTSSSASKDSSTSSGTSHSKSTDSSVSSTTRSSSTSATTTLPPRTAAPEITITPTYTPDCIQGYSTLTMPAVMSAPANAASLKFLIPKADILDTNWKVTLLKGFVNDPADQVKKWQVGSDTAGKDGPLISSGNGGQGMDIKWQTPKDNKNVYLELLFNDGLGIQTNGMSVVGDGFTCMPSACSGPPTISETETSICSLLPCSNSPSCTPKALVPHAACDIYTDGLGIIPLWYDVTIYTNGWVTDNGDKLHDEEKGCGDLLSWHANTVTDKIDGGAWTATNAYSFTLPLTIKSGCVERAIKSAGGPDGLKCFNYDVTDWGNPFGGIGI